MLFAMLRCAQGRRDARGRGSARSGWLAFLVAVALVGTGGAASGDDRPTEIPYDTPGTIPLLDPTYKRTSHEVVLITDYALQPRTVTLEEGQLIAWISYSAVPSVVVFEREVARSMICHSLVNFSIQDDELRSAPIHAGEFASFCQLQPGRYRYKIVRPTRLEKALDAASRLEGWIVVGDLRSSPPQ